MRCAKIFMILLVSYFAFVINVDGFQVAHNGHFVVSQEKAVPGDTIFYVLYLFQKGIQPTGINTILPAALVDGDGEEVLRFDLKVTNGKSANQVVLPKTLNQGFYNLSVALGTGFITKRIKVVTSNEIKLQDKRHFAVGIQGNLIRGLPSQIAFAGSIPGEQVYLMTRNKQVDSTVTDTFGTGSFFFIPENDQYTIQSAEQKVEVKSLEKGVGVTLKKTAESIQLRLIRKNEEIQTISTVLTCDGEVIQNLGALQFNTSNYVDLKLVTSVLPTGIYNLRISSSEEQLLTEIPFFTKREPLNALKIVLNQTLFMPGDQVKWSLQSFEVDKTKIWGMSALIKHEKYISPTDTMSFDLFTGFSALPMHLLEGNFQGDHQQSINNYLLATAGKRNAHQYGESLQIEGSLKAGSVVNLSTGLPLEPTSRLAIYFQEANRLIQINPSSDGRISVNTTGIYGKQNVFVLAENSSGERVDVNIDWDEFGVLNWPNAPPFDILDKIDDYATYRQTHQLIKNSYQTAVDILASGSITDSNIFSNADHTINLDEYISFPTMQEVIKELIPGTYVRTRKDKSFIRINVNSPMPPSKFDPIYIIDDHVTLNTSYVVQLDPAEIKTIKVYKSANKLLPMGLFGANGILVIESYNGNLKPPDSAKTLPFTGLQEPLAFSKVDFSTDAPQFRCVLFWDPSVRLTMKGETKEVQALDDQAAYYIIISGFTINGRPFRTYRKFTVNFNE